MSPSSHLLNRVRSEFIEMPGLRLRLDQAQRLFTLERGVCETVLRSLVEAKFLGRFEDEVYGRLWNSQIRRFADSQIGGLRHFCEPGNPRNQGICQSHHLRICE